MKKLIVSILVLIASQNIFAQSGWQSIFWNNPLVISKIIQRDSLNYFACSSNSRQFLKSSDGGLSWNVYFEQAFDTNISVRDGKFLNSLTGWIIGNEYFPTEAGGLIYKTTNGGINWINQNNGVHYYSCNNIDMLNLNTGWISLPGYPPNPSLLKTTNGGLNWKPVSNPLTYGIHVVNFCDENNGWILASNGFLSRTTNSGMNWYLDTTFKQFYIRDVAPISQNDCWLLVNNSNIPNAQLYKTTNGGDNWNLQIVSSHIFSRVNFKNALEGYLFGDSVIFKTTNGGINWDSAIVKGGLPVLDILPLNNNTYLTGGGKKVESMLDVNTYVNIMKSTNSGQNWSQIYYNRNYWFVAVHFKDSQNGLAVEEKGLILKTTNGGVNWIKIYEDLAYKMVNMISLSDTNLLVFRTDGKLLRTADYGEHWTEVITPVNDLATKLQFINQNTGFSIGGRPYLQKTSNGGLSWDTIGISVSGNSFPPATSCSGLSFINATTGWFASWGSTTVGGHGTFWSNVIKKTTNSGINWNIVYDASGYQYTNIKFFSENNGVAWYGNNIYHSTNSGSNWTTYSQNPNYSFIKLFMSDSIKGWMTGKSGSKQAIFKTTNGGFNWFLQFDEGKAYIGSIYIKDSINVWACGDLNGIYKTTNGGGIISSVNSISYTIPDNYSLYQNYPNPFNPSTRINYELRNSNYVTLKVFDLLGKEVATLVNEKQNPGSYAVDFNSTEFNLPSGIYFYTLNAGEFKETRKMVLVK